MRNWPERGGKSGFTKESSLQLRSSSLGCCLWCSLEASPLGRWRCLSPSRFTRTSTALCTRRCPSERLTVTGSECARRCKWNRARSAKRPEPLRRNQSVNTVYTRSNLTRLLVDFQVLPCSMLFRLYITNYFLQINQKSK
ncbi:hypothetical protein PRIPAC_81912, partial [Pristionchus pacificus]